MPIIKSAAKRMRTNAKARARNVSLKQAIKDATKAFRAKPSSQTLSKAQSTLDTAVKKNLLEKRTAARRKSQLSKEAKAAKVKLVANKKPTASKAAAKPTAKKTVAKKPATKTVTSKKPVTKKTPAKKAAVKKPAAKKSPTKK